MSSASLPTTLETVTGKFIDLINPDPDDICIEDIAWSLSRLARFNGHTIQTIPYSVAQHSIAVANEVKNFMEAGDPMPKVNRMVILGLMHDASEAYTGDISGPLKKVPTLRPVIKEIEHNIQNVIYQAIGIEPPTEHEEKIIKRGDIIQQRVEAYNFMVSRGQLWSEVPQVSIVKLQEFEMPIPSIEAYHRFLDMFSLYKPK